MAVGVMTACAPTKTKHHKYGLGTATGPVKGIQHEHGASDNDFLGWSATSQWCRLYDSATVGEFTGEVTSTSRFSPFKGMSPGVHFKLKIEEGKTLAVHLGPEYYLDKQPVKIRSGDKVTVRGSLVEALATEIVIADWVKKGDEVLTLRVGDRPAWIEGGLKPGGPHEMPTGTKVGPTKTVP
ncbi:MAG: hypothetical protein K8I02_13275 [Candidatus Methylomirabilis sp.]|nr:hypothetical protein [Deltaproteobacteria bacterium]